MIPKNKYYLGNADYYNIDYLLCPYLGVHYHLKEVTLMKKKLTTQEKLLNFCYTSLQNMIKQIFVITKY